jgi:hypothetical protein
MTNRSLRLLLLMLTLAVFGSSAPMVSAQATGGEEARPGIVRQKLVLTQAMENVFWHAMQILRCIYWMAIASHILFALLVFLDIKKRKQGSMLFVLLTLLGGVLAAGVYALFRMGDDKA